MTGRLAAIFVDFSAATLAHEPDQIHPPGGGHDPVPGGSLCL
jgi:hypothetical protein